jgi:hypothetical protein
MSMLHFKQFASDLSTLTLLEKINMVPVVGTASSLALIALKSLHDLEVIHKPLKRFSYTQLMISALPVVGTIYSLHRVFLKSQNKLNQIKEAFLKEKNFSLDILKEFLNLANPHLQNPLTPEKTEQILKRLGKIIDLCNGESFKTTVHELYNQIENICKLCGVDISAYNQFHVHNRENLSGLKQIRLLEAIIPPQYKKPLGRIRKILEGYFLSQSYDQIHISLQHLIRDPEDPKLIDPKKDEALKKIVHFLKKSLINQARPRALEAPERDLPIPQALIPRIYDPEVPLPNQNLPMVAAAVRPVIPLAGRMPLSRTEIMVMLAVSNILIVCFFQSLLKWINN